MMALDELRQRIEGEYRRRTPRSRELHERAQAWLPGGDTRTGTVFAPYPTYMERGEGNYLYDVDGNRLLDFTNNATSLIHGHAHPALVRAIREQAARGTGWHAPHESQARLARLLCERVPSLELVRFCNSGTEANMNAIKAARAFTGRDRIVKMDSAYHGSYEGVEFDGPGDSANGAVPVTRPDTPGLHDPLPAEHKVVQTWRSPAPTSRGVPRSMAENVLMMPFDDCDAARRLVSRHRHELAAVLVNPIVTRAGLHLPSPGYLACLREVTRDSDVLLIFDEVITLRIARGGAQDYYGVVPDLTAMGKIVGGGLPVGAFGGRADIMGLFAAGDPPLVPHAGTFNGNPPTMAAGLVSLELLTPDAFARLADLGASLRDQLAAVVADCGLAFEVNAIVSLVSLDLPRQAAADPTAAQEIQRLIHLALLNRGIKATGILAISTVMGAAEIDLLATELRAVLTEFQPAIGAAAPSLLRTQPATAVEAAAQPV